MPLKIITGNKRQSSLTEGVDENIYARAQDVNPTITEVNRITEVLSLVSKDFANDGAAATGGILVGELYHTAGAVKIRLV